MVYGYAGELKGWAITLEMPYALDRIRGFWKVSSFVIFFTESTFDFMEYTPLFEL